MIHDKNYWQGYYNEKMALVAPSPFAKYVFKNYLKKNMKLLELGCGNGRDSLFFANHDITVVAIDQCMVKLAHPNITFKQCDFTSPPDNMDVDVIYSRLSLHSIDKSSYERIMKWFRNIDHKVILCIEVRGKKNEYYGLGTVSLTDPDMFNFQDHYRRFIDFEILKNDIKNAGYEFLYAKERKGFAPYKGTNQTFIRLICEK